MFKTSDAEETNGVGDVNKEVDIGIGAVGAAAYAAKHTQILYSGGLGQRKHFGAFLAQALSDRPSAVKSKQPRDLRLTPADSLSDFPLGKASSSPSAHCANKHRSRTLMEFVGLLCLRSQAVEFFNLTHIANAIKSNEQATEFFTAGVLHLQVSLRSPNGRQSLNRG